MVYNSDKIGQEPKTGGVYEKLNQEMDCGKFGVDAAGGSIDAGICAGSRGEFERRMGKRA